MRRAEEASGRFKALLSLAFLAAIIFVAVKILPAYVANFQLEDHIRQLSLHLAVRTKPSTPEEIRDEVVAFAQDHGIALAADNVKVTISRHISISVDYTVPVDLIVYTLRLHFTPSAETPSL
jgi:cell division protein FtsL